MTIREVFDTIGLAVYYGASFRNVLLEDKEALAAAIKLVKRLKAHPIMSELLNKGV